MNREQPSSEAKCDWALGSGGGADLELQRKGGVDLHVAQEERALVEALATEPGVTSSLHLLVLQERHAGTMLSRV
jgi:hypothetical protein